MLYLLRIWFIWNPRKHKPKRNKHSKKQNSKDSKIKSKTLSHSESRERRNGVGFNNPTFTKVTFSETVEEKYFWWILYLCETASFDIKLFWNLFWKVFLEFLRILKACSKSGLVKTIVAWQRNHIWRLIFEIK